MTVAARLYAILVSLIVVGSTIPTIFRSFSIVSVIASFVVVVAFLLPMATALASLGARKPKLERVALLLNKAYLFLAAAGAIGFAFNGDDGVLQHFLLFFMPAAFIAISFILNIIALQRQIKLRANETTNVFIENGG